MRIPHRFTYRGGPLDGQDALPTAARGQQFTIFRDSEGKALRTSYGDRWSALHNRGGKHPGFYSRVDIVGYDKATSTTLGEYVWTPPREKGGN